MNKNVHYFNFLKFLCTSYLQIIYGPDLSKTFQHFIYLWSRRCVALCACTVWHLCLWHS